MSAKTPDPNGNGHLSKRILYGLAAICAVLFLADFLYHRKSYVDIEATTGFYPVFAVAMCALIVLCARVMRAVLRRGEDYYAPQDTNAEDHPEADLGRERSDG